MEGIILEGGWADESRRSISTTCLLLASTHPTYIIEI
jgi:hypothetical protein